MTEVLEPRTSWHKDARSSAWLQGNRRRLLVFAFSFALAFVIGQFWNLSRPVEYLSSLRLQITLADAGGGDAAASSTYASRLQLVNSRPILSRLVQQLEAAGANLPDRPEAAVTALQSMMSVQPVAGSEVLQLQAVGPDPKFLADMLNALPDVIRAELEGRQRADADERLQRAKQELARLESRAQDRRQRLDEFRRRANVVAERDDNEAVAANKGLNSAINNAVEKEAAASAKLRALVEAQQEGRMNLANRQDAAVSSLESKAHQVKEDLREMERSFTPAFMEMDPKARALRARLGELERQISQQRAAGNAAALQTAREELAGVQLQLARLREKQAAAKPILGKVSARINDAKVLEDDLAQVDKARRELIERVAKLESNDQRRSARVTVIESAVAPSSPFRPDRLGDGLWVLGGSSALALVLMGLVELFNRPPPAEADAQSRTTVVVTPAWSGNMALASAVSPLPLAGEASAQPPLQALGEPPRVLLQPEAVALVASARGAARRACVLGLLGLSMDEALALTEECVDREASMLHVPGSWTRSVSLPSWFVRSLEESDPGRPLLHDAAGRPLTEHIVRAYLIAAALDGELPRAASLNWQALRNTCIDWLLEEGWRFAELPSKVGFVDADLQAAFAERLRRVERSGGEANGLMPALRLDPAG